MGALLALIPLIGSVLPNLVPALATPMLGNILGKAGDIAQKVFGTTDPTQISLQIEQDKTKLDTFKAHLEAATEDERLMYADVQSARTQTVGLATSGSLIAWGTPILSILVSVSFFVTLIVFIHTSLNLPEFQQAILNIMLGFLGSAFQQTVNYWLGSSKSSRDKDDVLANLAINTVPTSAVTALANGRAKAN